MLYSRRKRWSDKGVFARIIASLTAEQVEDKTVLIDATHLAVACGHTLGWVDWFNNRRLPGPIGNIHPAEAEENIHAQHDVLDMVA